VSAALKRETTLIDYQLNAIIRCVRKHGDERTVPKSYKYKIADTTKVQREKYVNDAISISVLGASEPSPEAKRLFREYIDGKLEISDVLQTLIERYRVNENT
jgi:hypothetical protein